MSRWPEQRRRGDALAGEFGSRADADDNGAGRLEPRDGDGILRRGEAVEQAGALGDAPARDPDIVLDDDRRARQRQHLAGADAPVDRFSIRQRPLRIDGDDGVERSCGLDPLQRVARCLFGRQAPRRDRCGNVKCVHSPSLSRRSRPAARPWPAAMSRRPWPVQGLQLVHAVPLCLSCPHDLAAGAMMAGGISIHAVDVAAGRPAHGLRVEIWRLTPDRTQLVDGRLGADGVLKDAVATGAGVVAGDYEVLFHFDEFYRDSGRTEPAFLTTVPFRFAIHRIEEHFYLPLKFTPWGFSLFSGA